jgi:hypothetical protein
MAKRKRRTTRRSIARRLKEGRGKGRLADYKPWLHIQDVPSLGLACRAKGWKTERVHHLLSILELLYFFVLEWSSNVVDIREQYALLPLEETLAIANSCGIRHPVDPKTRQPIVMTTDFVVTVRHGNTVIDQPRTVKYRDDLFSPRTLEKLEIERRYWEARGKKLKIVTECSIPRVLAQNVQWLHPYRRFQDFTDLPDLILSLVGSIVVNTLQTRNAPLSDITNSLDDELGVEAGTCLAITRHLIANRVLRVDMLKPINPRVRLILLD